ncbi:glycosyltransferase family 39 protein [Olleya sp. AH-315-F22]|nr:glycosyltransferase family 39 protein [Olleya sp. AH-315-F22]
MFNKKQLSNSNYIFVSVIILLIFRFILLGAIPLLDKTEARYGEIARLMYETKEWIVLQIDYGIPFWAKPPLSTWLSASSFQLFGVNEISARLPSFLLSIGLLFILGNLVKKAKTSFYLPAFILLTTPEFLLHTGVVSTDTALCFCVALIMISFWKAINSEKYSFWNYLFFIAVGLGFLSKGPLVLVLTAPPIFIWILIQKVKLKDVYLKLPWFIGFLITAVIAIPWYILAEIRSPGFIDYFIIGEHFKRFFVSGWQGDLYGSGHSQPLGMIWVFLMIFAFPWIQIVLFKLWKDRKNIFKDKWISYLVLWLFWTPLFFTLSKNILHTYILPVMIPMALLIVQWWEQYVNKKRLLAVSSIFPALVIIGTTLFIASEDKWEDYLNTDKYLIKNQNIENLTPVYYWENKSYSSQFYTNGKVKNITNKFELDSVSKSYDTFFMLVKNKRIKEIPNEYMMKLIRLDSSYKTSIFLFGN